MYYFKKIFFITPLLILCTAFQVAAKEKNDFRIQYNFNSQWLIKVGDTKEASKPEFEDSEWKGVTLPYAWNQDEAYRVSIHELSTGIAWYRKHFKLSKSQKDKKVFMEFEGVRQGADFYVNGHHIGFHENGVMAVGFDITRYLNFGNKDNVVALRTDNDWKYKERTTGSQFQWNNDNFNVNYGGIPKNVFLHVTNKVYQTLPLYSNLKTVGIYVYATHIDIQKKAVLLHVESEVRNESGKEQKVQLQVDVKDLEGKIVGSFTGEESYVEANGLAQLKSTSPLSNIEFWSWGYGYLYDVHTTLFINNKPVDEVITRTGFRKTAFKNGEFYLNDRVLQVKGYAQRTSNEWPAIGMSVPPWMSDYSNRLMLESNGNTVRWMHVTPWKQDVESCDRVGLIQAMPAGDAEKDITDRRWEQRVELMRDAIIYNRNNPSIIFYEGGNESISEKHMAGLKAVRDQYDPHGGRAVGSREMLDSKEAEYGGEMLYINKSGDIPMWAMEYSRDEGLRKYWDNYSFPYHKDGDGPLYRNKDASEYNRNQDTHAIEDVVRWFDYYEMRPGTGTRVSSGGVNIVFSDTQTHYRGAENYRRSGEVDPMRIPKDNFFAHQVMWDGWVDIEKYRTHIVGHWNYTDTVSKDIFVISSGEKVELFINGKSKGFGQQSYRFLYTFNNMKWKPGIIKAISYSRDGLVLSTDSIQTAGKPTSLQLTKILNPGNTKANGADVAIIEVEVVDVNGQRCPVANNMVSFRLEGEGTWLGGIAQGPDNYNFAKSLPVECGINRVMVKATTKAGDIQLFASAEGLKSASTRLTTVPFIVENGLALDMPADGLDVNLDRGPTPSTSSYKTSRIEIPIISATAGSNREEVRLSYDDNELSEWKNDGMLSTAWITYTLDTASLIDECIIKLKGWRARQYPIRILVDGNEVYCDTTKRSLGYVTLPLQQSLGSEVTVQLIGISKIEDAFGQIVELVESKEPESGKDHPRGNLNIVEIGFFTRLE